MEKIAIFSAGDGKAAARLASLFNEGNRIFVEIVFTDNPSPELARTLREAGAVVATPNMPDEQAENAVTGLLRTKGVTTIVLDNYRQPLPEAVLQAVGNRVLEVSDPDTAPLLLVDFIKNDGQPAQQSQPSQPSQVTPESQPTPDQEWAQTLGINYNPEENQEQPQAPTAQAAPETAPSARTSGAPSDQPMPPTYLVWSIVMTVLCCFVPGVVAIIFSSQVTSKWQTGDIEGARKASERAQIWIIVSFVLGVLSATLYAPIMMVS